MLAARHDDDDEYIYIYLKNKKILKISIFLFKVKFDLKSCLIISKVQLSARQLFLILKVSEFI